MSGTMDGQARPSATLRSSRRRTPEPGRGEGARRAPIIRSESSLVLRFRTVTLIFTKDRRINPHTSLFQVCGPYRTVRALALPSETTSACALVVPVCFCCGSVLKSCNVLNFDHQLRRWHRTKHLVLRRSIGVAVAAPGSGFTWGELQCCKPEV